MHGGFANAYATVRGEVVAAVAAARAASPAAVPVFVVGHSLGGAMASFCALHLCLLAAVDDVGDGGGSDSGGDGGCGEDGGIRLSRPPLSLVLTTYGSPKVGNAAYVRLLTRAVPHHWRVVATNDVVSTAPPLPWYRHAGRLVLLDRTGNLWVEPLAAVARFFHRDAASVVAHSLGTYLLSLARVAEVAFDLPPPAREVLFWGGLPVAPAVEKAFRAAAPVAGRHPRPGGVGRRLAAAVVGRVGGWGRPYRWWGGWGSGGLPAWARRAVWGGGEMMDAPAVVDRMDATMAGGRAP